MSTEKNYEELYFESSEENRKLMRKLKKIESLFPKKYFKIDFRTMTNNGCVNTYSELISGLSLDLAITDLKNTLYAPESFMLIDAKLIG